MLSVTIGVKPFPIAPNTKEQYVQANDHGSSRRQPRILPLASRHIGPSGNHRRARSRWHQAHRAHAGSHRPRRGRDLRGRQKVCRSLQVPRRRHRRPHHHPAQLRRRAWSGRRYPSRRSARPRTHPGHARRARQNVHRPPPRQLLRQDVHLQQPHPVRHPLLTHHAAHRVARLARVRRRPRLVRRRLPRRSRIEEPPHRRHRRTSHRIQHRPLLGKITGAQRHHRRNP